MNPQTEPLVAQAAVHLIVTLLARYGFHADADTLVLLNAAVLAVGTYVTRKFVTPTAKLPPAT